MTVWERLIIDGNAVYEIDEECARQRQPGGQKKGQGLKSCRGGGPRKGKETAAR